MVETAGERVNIGELAEVRTLLKREVTTLKGQRTRLCNDIKQSQERLEQSRREEAEARQHRATLDADCQAKTLDLEALRALRVLLVQPSVPSDAFWSELFQLANQRQQQLQDRGSDPAADITEHHRLRDTVLRFLQRLMG